MKKFIASSLASLFFLSTTNNLVYAEVKLITNQQKYSYAVGIQVANNIKKQDIQLDPESLTQAIKDVLNGKPLKATKEELDKAISALHEENKKKQQQQAQLSIKAGKAFQAKYKQDKSVITLKDGIQYKIIAKGQGKKPQSTDIIVAHYEGKLINGTVFDSSYKRKAPSTFPINRVIKGWQKIIPMMPLGSIWEIVIPADLAYGDQGAGKDIGPGETLIFKIELISITS